MRLVTCSEGVDVWMVATDAAFVDLIVSCVSGYTTFWFILVRSKVIGFYLLCHLRIKGCSFNNLEVSRSGSLGVGGLAKLDDVTSLWTAFYFMIIFFPYLCGSDDSPTSCGCHCIPKKLTKYWFIL